MTWHQESENCHCSPTMIPVKHNDGFVSYVIAHKELNQTPAQQAERAAKIFEAIQQLNY